MINNTLRTNPIINILFTITDQYLRPITFSIFIKETSLTLQTVYCVDRMNCMFTVGNARVNTDEVIGVVFYENLVVMARLAVIWVRICFARCFDVFRAFTGFVRGEVRFAQ
jgi:hypothetical protein